MATFGSMDNISREEYLAFYQQTGIDIDNRQAMVLEALKHTEMALARMISFSKVIPGFENLLIEDQVNLIKCKFMVVFKAHRLFTNKGTAFMEFN